jgi:outer membrane protein OmpA-like peptidoglycan-associated protein
MNRWLVLRFCSGILFLLVVASNSYGQIETSSLQFLKEQEIKNKDSKGEIYLGRVMTLTYPASGSGAGKKYHPLLLELTDVLKTPLRKNYRLVLKGFTDSRGRAESNLRLSRNRAEELKKLLIKKYYMKEERITTEAYGSAGPVASNKTAEGRRLNRRVEIHVHGDVSEAVRFID